MAAVRPSAMRMTMNPPPPMLPAPGYVTASANPVATAASTAFPPRRMISRPTLLAIESLLETIACSANVAGVPAWKRQPCGKTAADRDGASGAGVLTTAERQATSTAAIASPSRTCFLECVIQLLECVTWRGSRRSRPLPMIRAERYVCGAIAGLKTRCSNDVQDYGRDRLFLPNRRLCNEQSHAGHPPWRRPRHLRRTFRARVGSGDGAGNRRHRDRLHGEGNHRGCDHRGSRSQSAIAADRRRRRIARRIGARLPDRVDAVTADPPQLLLADHVTGRRPRAHRRICDATIRRCD